MKIRIPGSSAGGGLPQWNGNCANCRQARNQTADVLPRTQSSIAMSKNGVDWILINASPDLLAQLRANPELQPARTIRESGIAAVGLIDAQIDHVTSACRAILQPTWAISRSAAIASDPAGSSCSMPWPMRRARC